MARNLTDAVDALAATQYATEPVVIIKIVWLSGTVYYADKDISVGAISAVGWLTQFSPVSTASKNRGSADYSSASITLFDADDSLKDLINRYQLAGVAVTAYHYYESTGVDDFVPLITGKLKNPTWAEGSRTLSFDCEVEYEAQEVGYTPELGAFPTFNNDEAGNPWPLCFGTVLEVPAIKAEKYGQNGLTSRDFSNSDETCHVENKVQDGDFVFPESLSMNLEIGGIICEGTFGDAEVTDGTGFDQTTWTMPVFTISQYNLAHHSSLAIAARDEFDPDRDNAAVLWIEDDQDLVGQYCIINSTYGWVVNYCERQRGNKCFFRKAWQGNGSPNILLGTGTIYETAPIVRESWAATYVAASNDSENRNYSYKLTSKWQIEEYRDGNNVVKGRFTVYKGAECIYESPNQKDIYVCNMVPSSKIVDVWAWRNYGSERIFAPVPSSYYTKYLSLLVGPHSCTAIVFDFPLSRREKEEWDDQIYVSLRSSITSNPAGIIKHIIETYTDLTIDETSFDEVMPKVENFWMCFASTDMPDAISLINNLAWQARCGLINDAGTVKIKFLPEEVLQDLDLDEDWVGGRTLRLTSSDIDDVITVLNGSWNKTYSQRDDSDRAYVYRNNESEYGSKEQSESIFAFNMEYCVKACLDFWGYRYSNLWRQVSLRTFFNALKLQPFDFVRSQVDTISTNEIKGVIQSVSHNSDSDFIDVMFELASKVADVDGGGQPIQDSDYWPGNPSVPDILDPAAGRAEVDYIPPIPAEPESSGGGGGDTGGGGSGGGGGTTNDLYLVFEQIPTAIERGSNFDLVIKMVKYDGTIFNTGRSFILSIQSSDGSDVLNVIQGTFSGGYYSTSSAQITGGAGVDSAAILVTAQGADAKVSDTFDVTDTLTGTLTVTIPASAARLAGFTIDVAGGVNGLVVDLALNSSDNQDKLYDSADALLTQVTLGAGGTATISNAYIAGGQGSDVAEVIGSDATQVYADAVSGVIALSGLSVSSSTGQAAAFSGLMRYQTEDLILETVGTFEIYKPFELKASYVDSAGAPQDYNGSAVLKARNVTDNSLIDWATVGPNATSLGNTVTIQFTDGVWQQDGLELNWVNYWDTDIQFEVFIDLVTYTLADIIEVAIDQAYLNIDIPINVTRGVSFSFKVQALNDDGTPNASFVPSDSLQIVLGNTNGEVISPEWVSPASWSGGEVTVTVTVSGGSGAKSLVFSMEDPTLGISGIASAAVGVTTYTKAVTPWGQAFVTYTEEPYPYVNDTDPTAYLYWNEARWAILGLFNLETFSAGGNGIGGEYELVDRHSYISAVGTREASMGSFPITAAGKASLVAGAFNIKYESSVREYMASVWCSGWYNYWARGSVIVRFTSDPYSIANGEDVRKGTGAEFSETISVPEANTKHWYAGGNVNNKYIGYQYSFDVNMSEELLEWLRNYPGDTVYACMYVNVMDEDYTTDYTGGNTGHFSCPPMGLVRTCEVNSVKLIY